MTINQDYADEQLLRDGLYSDPIVIDLLLLRIKRSYSEMMEHLRWGTWFAKQDAVRTHVVEHAGLLEQNVVQLRKVLELLGPNTRR